MLGVAVVVGLSRLDLTPLTLLAMGCSLLAALCYGIGGVYTKLRFPSTPALTLTIGQQLGAGLVLLPIAAAHHPMQAPSPSATLAAICLALLSTSVAYLLYFHLIGAVGPTKTHTYSFLVPIFGILWGALFLHESVPAGVLTGLALILVSLALITDTGWASLRA
jgi:drug/metabolite transporter (DMT)-like permease